MTRYYSIVFVILFLACEKKSVFLEEQNCETKEFLDLEKIDDVKKMFTVQFPSTWKTNLYYDQHQSSIYTADTTKQLTETMLLDITYITNKMSFDEGFIKKFKTNLSKQGLLETVSRTFNFKNKNAYYSIAQGNKGNFPYQISNLFIKINENNYIHSKIEVYGDSLVSERICNGLNLLDKISY